MKQKEPQPKTLHEAANRKHQIVKAKKERQALVDKAQSKHKERISSLQRFITIEDIDIPTFFNLSGPMALYMYLRMEINRKPQETWGNLGKWYREGYLATLRTEQYMAKKFNLNQSTVGKWFKKLEEEGFIKEISKETIRIGESYQDHPVYALGEAIIIDDERYENWYYEILERKKKTRNKGVVNSD